MKNVVIAILIFILAVAIFGNFGSINYDKAYRDMIAMTVGNPSMSIQEAKNVLNEMGMTSKDYFTLIKSSSESNQLLYFYSLDMTQNMFGEYNIDFNNLKRALER